MKIIHFTTIVLSAASGMILGIFISPAANTDALILEALLLGASVGVTVGSIIWFPNLEFIRNGLRKIVIKKSSGRSESLDSLYLNRNSKSIANAS